MNKNPNFQRRFQRTKENFRCESCQKEVFGNGYTNHCPFCLWSKHVDVFPGDRAESCGALMEPIAVTPKAPYRLTHRCSACGEVRQVKSSDVDDFDALIEVAQKAAKRC